jgi:hypothetical protein
METTPVTPARIMQLGMGFMASKALLTAVELGLFTALAEGPLDGGSLRRRLDLHERGARDFFDTLVALGLLARDDRQRYANTRMPISTSIGTSRVTSAACWKC